MSSPKTQYLIAYNGLSASLWLTLLIRVITTVSAYGYTSTYPSIGEYTRWVQTLALLEVLHSATGIVRAPLFTTLIQVASRLFLVHAIVAQFPQEAAVENPFYTSMLLAWSTTEVVRYSFFVKTLSGQGSGQKAGAENSLGGLLTWLRYNTFFVLYPVGIGSEIMCIWRAMGRMKSLAGGDLSTSGNGIYGLAWWGCVVVLGIYIPGSWILYTYMMAQRKKVAKGDSKSGKARTKKSN